MIRAPRLCVFLTALLANSAAAQTAGPEAARATHLLQRATWGARPADVDAVLAMGRTAWLDRQLEPRKIDDPAAEARLKSFPSLQRGMAEMVAEFQRLQRERRLAAQVASDTVVHDRRDARPARDSAAVRAARRANAALAPQLLLLDLASARITRAVETERQLEDVMTDFWYNHFNVYFGKGIDRFLVADYEATAIRPHVFGRFRDMLGATAKHPAMLFYLDNATSVAEGAIAAGRQRGLNENYARELLELHTLGVDGGYTQQDIVNVARALTGWSFTRPGGRAGDGLAFTFRRAMHDAEEKVVLGHRLKAGRGMEDGEEVLDLLARHPATARHIARKLVERFVTDQPDPAFVDELADVFIRTDGDLRAVTRALFTSERFYADAAMRAKVKTPFELVVSALRVTGAETGRSRGLVQTLRMLGQLPYNAAEPTGYPSASDDWVNSGAMVNRMNFALALAAGRLDGVRIDARGIFGGSAASDPKTRIRLLLAQLMPGVETGTLEATILREISQPASSADQPTRDRDARRQAAVRALGLALGSPAFQKK